MLHAGTPYASVLANLAVVMGRLFAAAPY